MDRASFDSPASIKRLGRAIPGALVRHQNLAGFDQEAYSRASVLCIGAGGLISFVAPTLCRKGIGRLTILDRDVVEASNLNRQMFFPRDIGKSKAHSLVRNLQPFCTADTVLMGYGCNFEDAAALGVHMTPDVVVCGIDNNPGRVAVSRYFRQRAIPVVFLAVSADADHGYVFVQDRSGPCLGCLFPDMVNDDRYPCPGTPAVADILQTIGGLAVYATDTVLVGRSRHWNYRRLSLSTGITDGFAEIDSRAGCSLVPVHDQGGAIERSIADARVS
ncbi:MAG TPA: ThiF family adenylyltransferase [Candidatus Limnocylindrales bacterium]|nr:ThiF family adenylyltransferase [Candidatus Limnocylindrales bacterium]